VVTVRRLLAAVAVVAVPVLLALAADRVADRLAERTVAGRLQQSQHLSARPGVDITGFPFLTQAIRGRYDRIDLHIRGLRRDPMRLSRVYVRLSGVRVPLRAALSRRADEVPVASARAEAC
jgi:hypothetical protein